MAFRWRQLGRFGAVQAENMAAGRHNGLLRKALAAAQIVAAEVEVHRDDCLAVEGVSRIRSKVRISTVRYLRKSR